MDDNTIQDSEGNDTLTPADNLRNIDHQEEIETNVPTSRKGPRINYKELHRSGRRANMLHIFKKAQRKLRKKYKVSINDTFRRLVRVVMLQMQTGAEFGQMSMREGIKKYGELAIQAVLAEYSQLDNKGVFVDMNPDELSAEQKSKALDLITLVKYKRNGKFKGRACANRKKQRKYIGDKNVSSPTCALESLILTLIVEAFEHRDVAVADVPGAYLCAEMDDFVLVKVRGESVTILCECNSDYKKYVIKEKNTPVLYLKLAKALYGCLQSALLWYETFTTCLKDLGFTLNPYDPCVGNMMVNGKQCTITWYVDDTKISHEAPNVVSWVIEEIEQRFGKMTVDRGKKHTFVGMDFELLSCGKVKITMKNYIRECIEGFESLDGILSGKATTPGQIDLFEIDEDEEPLSEEKAIMFHHIVAKMLYISKQARIDADLVVSFLCTRVSKSTIQDWNKLKRLMLYLKKTIDMPRILGASRLDTLWTWVDASYGTHHDRKGHTGGVMSLGTGVVNIKSSKQKLNTKSSTETEVVGASDYLPITIWTKRFMEKQGYKIQTNIYFQDNQSAMRIEKNGRQSCGDKSKHIHIRYFFIKDLLVRENITLEHCKTDIMVADYFTKPLQGSSFKQMRDYIMGLDRLPLKERVEGNVNDVVDLSEPSIENQEIKIATYAEIVGSG